ncbi:MAG TPA: hypothetical protein VMD53_01200 [Rhizomicrobium sp.]|nr:hypothetical protein [Rhizomicrobium sp.]
MDFDLSDADGLTGKDLAEIDLLHFEADAAAGGDGDDDSRVRAALRRDAPMT